MSNARQFINSYNKIDSMLRNLYNFKSNQSFSEIIRKVAQENLIIRKYEDELIDYARLRNAIVHKSVDEVIIAEPHDEVTKKMLLIENLLCCPPKIKDTFKDKNIVSFDVKFTLKEAITVINKTGYSNIPVYASGKMIGIINNKTIINNIGKAIENGFNLDEYVLNTKVKDVITERDMLIYYLILSKLENIDRVLFEFEKNKKLLAVLVTENGIYGEQIKNIITPYDLPIINKLLEEYV